MKQWTSRKEDTGRQVRKMRTAYITGIGSRGGGDPRTILHAIAVIAERMANRMKKEKGGTEHGGN